MLIVAAMILTGCARPAVNGPSSTTFDPTPTVALLFNRPVAVTPVVLPTPIPLPTPPPAPSGARRTQARSTADEQLSEISVFDDRLDPAWGMDMTWAMRTSLASTRYVHNGTVAMAVTPTEDAAGLFFTVNRDAGKVFARDKILGVSFWLNPGTGTIETSDLAVTVLGSNAHPYFVKGDSSVTVTGRMTEETTTFSETRLYYLGINRAIPPDTWVEVIVWLDKLIYDPEYTYVTGIYIKNATDFRQTFYIDQLNLLTERSASTGARQRPSERSHAVAQPSPSPGR